MVVQNKSKLGKGSANLTDPHHIHTIIHSSTQPQKTQKPRNPKRKDTQVAQPSDPGENVVDAVVHKELGDSLVRAATTASSLEGEQGSGNTLQSDEDRLKLNELMELCTNLQTRVLDLEKTKTTQQNEIDSLKRRVKKLEKKRSSRTHKLKRLYKVGLSARVESSGDEESLGEDASKQGRINAINADEEITLVKQSENVVEEVVNVAQVSTTATTVTITTEEITLAQALEALKTSKPKVKRIVFQEPEPVKPMKKKVQIMLDEEVASNLQAEVDEEERLVREKAKKENEANIALIETWDDIQAKIDEEDYRKDWMY
ncbi:hypothetical protein Tco_0580427 [Tanacetum coccineum]